MMRRIRGPIAVLALLAVAVLLLRPLTLSAIGAPFGSYNSPDVELVRAEGSPHCTLLADCETVSISNVGLDVAASGIVLVLAGVVLTIAWQRRPIVRSWTVLVPTPPPVFSLA